MMTGAEDDAVADFCNAPVAWVLLVMGALQIPDMIWYDMMMRISVLRSENVIRTDVESVERHCK